MNHMIHNLYPEPDRVYITYQIDFIPDSSPRAKRMKPVETQWMDVEGIKAYPVFDALKGSGKQRQVHLPRRRPERVQVATASAATAGWSTATRR